MSDIPPPATSLAPQAPAVPLTSFAGREPEIDLVMRLLVRPDVRLLTLTGPGGIGKTRLALEVGERVREQFADGILVVSLSSIQDPTLVPATVAQALGVPDAPGQTLLTRLQTFLHDRHLLPVLDNLEHLLDATASLVTGLLVGCPRITVLATSRSRLRISGEQMVPLDALSPEAARQLFTVRAQAVMPSFAATGELTPTIDAICAGVDRLPLAIELAAARIAVLPPTAMMNRLQHRLDVLTDGPWDAPTRQRTMRDTIAWSYDLLTEQEQRLFRRLGVFVGGFTLEAAQAVASEGKDALAGISGLVTTSLATPVEGIGHEPRFTMLETIREYALEQLVVSGEKAVICDAHAAWCLRFAQQAESGLNSPKPEVWSERVEAEMGNMRTALAWTIDQRDVDTALPLAAALGPTWLRRGPYGESRVRLEQALSLGDGPVGARVTAEVTLSQLAFLQGDLLRATALGEQALARAQAAGDRLGAANALLAIGQALDRQGDLGRSARYHDEALVLFRALGNTPGIAQTLDHLGMVTWLSGEFDRFAALAEETLALWRETDDRAQIITALDRLSLVARLRGEWERQAALAKEVVTLSWELGDQWVIASTLWTVASIAAERGQFDMSAQFFGAEEALREAMGFVRDPAFLCDYDQMVNDVRAMLGEAAFVSAWSVGRSLPPAHAVAEALSLLDRLMAKPGKAATTGTSVAGGAGWGLTHREVEVLRLLAEGYADKEIAAALNISRHTVGHHVASILAKLGVESRAAAAAHAVRQGLA